MSLKDHFDGVRRSQHYKLFNAQWDAEEAVWKIKGPRWRLKLRAIKHRYGRLLLAAGGSDNG